ncbi:MAG: hypothetical protein NTY77_17345 [Elusimicrobia bacterium]|nr:hypothetical protein [Elusimicrobiota bacterium]
MPPWLHIDPPTEASISTIKRKDCHFNYSLPFRLTVLHDDLSMAGQSTWGKPILSTFILFQMANR